MKRIAHDDDGVSSRVHKRRRHNEKKRENNIVSNTSLSLVPESCTTVDEEEHALKTTGEIDFNHLAQLYPDFAQICKYRNSDDGDSEKEAYIDWKDQESQIILTKTILKHKFNVNWDLPRDEQFLIPPVTNRVNYIRWIYHLLSSLGLKNTTHRGIDVGTGANIIYPLLGHAIYGWQFICTEINPRAMEIARENIRRNGWEQVINIVHQMDPTQILRGVVNMEEQFQFLMCNPPFFTDDELKERDNDPNKPNAICTGNHLELVTQGGEIEFVKKIVLDSLERRNNITIYSSMLGKKASIHPIRQFLYEHKITSVYVTEFIQGKTSRWGIAWTFIEQKSIVQQQTQSSIRPTMRQNVFHFDSATALMTSIEKCIRDRAASFAELTRIDKLGCVLHGKLGQNSTSNDRFQIQIMQFQPKQYSVQVKNVDKREATKLFQDLYMILKEHVLRTPDTS